MTRGRLIEPCAGSFSRCCIDFRVQCPVCHRWLCVRRRKKDYGTLPHHSTAPKGERSEKLEAKS